jgi:RHS repeat-associated protein
MFDQKYNFNLGADNGTLVSMTNNRVTDRSQTFSYDQLNRISTAQTTATDASDPAHCWGQAFGFDSSGDWSNLLSIGGVSSAYTGCNQNSLSVTVNASNQIVGDTYDAAGNLWIIPGTGGATYLYNAENQMTSTSNSSMSYIYDGDGNRVEKSGSKIYWMAGTEVLDETDTTGSVTNGSFNEYVFFAGNRIARRDSSGDVFYYLLDQVDSSRVIAEVPSGQTTATMCYDADLEPYGGEHAYINTCSQNYKFTGKERDTESDLDNFGARYYASTTGRFMTPDWALKPIDVPYAKFGDPQTLNLYTYVENSPLNRIDADGHSGGGPMGASAACGNDAPSAVVCESDAGGGRDIINNSNSDMADAPPTVSWDGVSLRAQQAQNTQDSTTPPPPPTPDPAGTRTDPALNPSNSNSNPSTTSSPSDQTQAPMESRGRQGGQGKGERGDTAKPDKPQKGLKQDKDGRWWEWKGHEGKWVPKPPGFNPDTAKKVGIGAAIVGGAVVTGHAIAGCFASGACELGLAAAF